MRITITTVTIKTFLRLSWLYGQTDAVIIVVIAIVFVIISLVVINDMYDLLLLFVCLSLLCELAGT